MTAENHSITDLLSELEATAGEVAIANTRAVAGVFPPTPRRGPLGGRRA